MEFSMINVDLSKLLFNDSTDIIEQRAKDIQLGYVYPDKC